MISRDSRVDKDQLLCRNMEFCVQAGVSPSSCQTPHLVLAPRFFIMLRLAQATVAP
jgi:hypothetical protein